MTEFHEWFQELQVERTLKALKKNNFGAQFVPIASDVPGEVFRMIPQQATVGIGGSVTLNQIGFFEEPLKHPIRRLGD